jgi:hypothetical protein
MKIIAPAYLRSRMQWVIPVCPLCGGEHVHGAPDGINDTGGHRVAHCAPQSPGYFIRPSPPLGDTPEDNQSHTS